MTAGILGHVLADIWLHAGGALREQWLDLTAQNLSRSEEFPDVCAVIFRTVAVSLIRLPAAFFGLTQGIGRSTHFSVEQIKIWKFLQRMTSKTVEKACAVLASTEPNLKSEWHQNIRASEMLLRIIPASFHRGREMGPREMGSEASYRQSFPTGLPELGRAIERW